MALHLHDVPDTVSSLTAPALADRLLVLAAEAERAGLAQAAAQVAALARSLLEARPAVALAA